MPTTKRRQSTAKRIRRKTKYERADASILFERMKHGSLRVDCRRGVVYYRKIHRNHKHDNDAFSLPWRQYTPFRDKQGYLFIRVRFRNRQKAFSVGRIIYMAHTGELIPHDMDIDHCDLNIENNRIRNLRLKTPKDNRRSCTSFQVGSNSNKGLGANGYPVSWDDIDEDF